MAVVGRSWLGTVLCSPADMPEDQKTSRLGRFNLCRVLDL